MNPADLLTGQRTTHLSSGQHVLERAHLRHATGR